MSDRDISRRLQQLEKQGRELAETAADLARAQQELRPAPARELVLKLLDDGVARSPLELSRLTGRSHQTLTHLVRKMAGAGDIVRTGWGQYTLPRFAQPGEAKEAQ